MRRQGVGRCLAFIIGGAGSRSRMPGETVHRVRMERDDFLRGFSFKTRGYWFLLNFGYYILLFYGLLHKQKFGSVNCGLWVDLNSIYNLIIYLDSRNYGQSRSTPWLGFWSYKLVVDFCWLFMNLIKIGTHSASSQYLINNCNLMLSTDVGNLFIVCINTVVVNIFLSN